VYKPEKKIKTIRNIVEIDAPTPPQDYRTRCNRMQPSKIKTNIKI
jgi:hypothetical protein